LWQQRTNRSNGEGKKEDDEDNKEDLPDQEGLNANSLISVLKVGCGNVPLGDGLESELEELKARNTDCCLQMCLHPQDWGLLFISFSRAMMIIHLLLFHGGSFLIDCSRVGLLILGMFAFL
jgi:hypothetical protein